MSEAPLELVLRLFKQHNDRAVFAIAMAQEIKNLRAALAEAREVIGPFAEAASFFEQRYLNTDVVADGERQGESYRIEIGHLRCARDFLERTATDIPRPPSSGDDP